MSAMLMYQLIASLLQLEEDDEDTRDYNNGVTDGQDAIKHNKECCFLANSVHS